MTEGFSPRVADVTLTTHPASRPESRLLLLSANDAEALTVRVESIQDTLRRSPSELDDIAYTLARGRKTFSHRAAVVLPETGAVEDVFGGEGLIIHKGVSPEGQADVAMMFPGQGSQFVSMGAQLYELNPEFRDTLDHCSRMLEPLIGLSVTRLLYGGLASTAEERTRTLTETSIAQPALFVIEYALGRILLDYGVKPALLFGHSVGEYTAACLAGIFSLDATLALVAERGRLMQSMPPGSMLAVKTDPETLAPLCHDGVDIAAQNAPGLVVVSGTTERIAAFKAETQERGLETTLLQTSHAFHSSMMDPILEDFSRAVERAAPVAPAVPVISTMTGQVLSDEEATAPEYWARQLRNPVRFADAVATACTTDARVLVEVGPGVALTTSAAKHTTVEVRPRKLVATLGHPKARTPAVTATLSCLGQLFVSAAEVDWDRVYDAKNRRLVRLPAYPYSRKRHWVSPPSAVATSSTAPQMAASDRAALPPAGSRPGPADRRTSVVEAVKTLLESRLGSSLEASDLERSFLELGFDSMALSQLVQKINSGFKVRLAVRRLFDDLRSANALSAYLATEGKAPVGSSSTTRPRGSGGPASAAAASSPTAAADLGEVVERLAQIQASIDELRRTVLPATPDSPDEAPQPLTISQREIWVASKVGGETANLAYNECRALRFVGNLDRDALLECMNVLAERHEALRQSFSEDGERCFVAPSVKLEIGRHDLRQLDPAAREERLEAICQRQVTVPFRLEEAPLFRGDLVRVGDEETWMVMCAHHLVVDGSSWGILLRELAELYSAGVELRPHTLPRAGSYRAYARADQQYRESAMMLSDEAYWLGHLRGQTEDLSLPADRQRPPTRTLTSTRRDQHFSASFMHRVRAAAARIPCTTQTLLLGAFQVLLHRLSRQVDFVVGIPVAGQLVAGIEALVGHCVHVLPLRATIDPARGVADHLRGVHTTMLDGLDHQRATYTELLEKLERPRDRSRPPLLQVAFGMGQSQKHPRFVGLETSLRVVPRVSETFELYVYATEDAGALEVSWSYNTDLFDARTIALWQRCFETLVTSIVESPEDVIEAIPLLSRVDMDELLRLAVGPVIERGPHVPVHQSIAVRADSHANDVAVVDVDGEHSYLDLQARANRIANWLTTLPLGESRLVAVCLERTVELVATLLGVWRAGLGYIPLDPDYPPQRIRTILEDSHAALTITSNALRDRISACPTIQCLDEIDLGPFPDRLASVPYEPDDTAYVIFTSGSTGRPKGVPIPQQAVGNFIWAMARQPGFTEADRLLAITTISFDISVLELFLPLAVGGTVILASRDQAMNPRELERMVERNGVTVMQGTPATWQMLFDGGWQGSPNLKVLCGGEAFPQHLAERFLESCGETWNVYGPTETTVWSSVERITDANDVTIGRPIDNTTFYVLDERRSLVPRGVHGELWIGGDGVADGYLGRADLTAERFVPSPFGNSSRLYRTGDLARVRADGKFECLGRADFQVKIRGFRIELGEIEYAILADPAVAACAVVAREGRAGDHRLVAYLVPNQGAAIDNDVLRRSLSERLPGYMVPGVFSVIDALPMTPNNKVDRKALPEPTDEPQIRRGPAHVEEETSATCANDSEAKVREVFVHHLGVTRLGVNDSFFDVGGHSLLAVRAIAELSRAFGTDLSVAMLFEHPTVRGLAKAIGEHDGKLSDVVVRIHDAGADTAPPVFFICGIALYQHLAVNMGDTFSSYGVYIPLEEAFFERHDTDDFLPVEELSRHYAETIRSHEACRDGRCVLGGVSFGGLLAFEVARQLQSQVDIQGLVLLDTILPGSKIRNARKSLAYHFEEARRNGFAPYVKERFRRRVKQALPHTKETNNSERLWIAMHGKATREYLKSRPRYEGDALVIRAAKRPGGSGFDYAPDLGWGNLVDRPTVSESVGDHLGILRHQRTAELIVNHVKGRGPT